MTADTEYDHAETAAKDTTYALFLLRKIAQHNNMFGDIIADLEKTAKLIENKKYAEAHKLAKKVYDAIPSPTYPEDRNMPSLRGAVIEIVWELDDVIAEERSFSELDITSEEL